MEKLKPYFNIVEKALKTLKVNPKEARGTNAGQWNLKRGTATVWLDVYELDQDRGAYFQAMAPVVTVPNEKKVYSQMCEDLLHINYQIFGIAFAIHENAVYLKFIREVEGLDESEVLHTIGRCGNYADFYNEKFVKRYKVRRIE